MAKKILLLTAAALIGVLFSMLQPIALKSIGSESLGKNNPNIRVTHAEIAEETDNSLTIRYSLRNYAEGVQISACGEVNYATYGYAWGCKPVIIPPYAGSIDITYAMASTARPIECSDNVGIHLYIGSGYHFYKHLFAYDKIWHKNPGAESWSTYHSRGCEPPRQTSELQHL
ncbi:hypothetical protein [Cellvibrio sp. UBA7661]|uniref:hypothetical protein n=1 Tax=Cellvibrio sp. UBA7661 TaxID=1946311 RepID=UPI002F353BF3